MRILSQCNNIDIPYEEATLCIDTGGTLEKGREICIYARTSSAEKFFVMTRYKTLEKARKAMEMLRNAYSPNIEIKEPIQKEMPKPRSGDWVWTVTEPKIEVFDNFYFQFPTDDEVEV